VGNHQFVVWSSSLQILGDAINAEEIVMDADDATSTVAHRRDHASHVARFDLS